LFYFVKVILINIFVYFLFYKYGNLIHLKNNCYGRKGTNIYHNVYYIAYNALRFFDNNVLYSDVFLCELLCTEIAEQYHNLFL